jgi:hypothetical protein
MKYGSFEFADGISAPASILILRDFTYSTKFFDTKYYLTKSSARIHSLSFLAISSYRYSIFSASIILCLTASSLAL